MKTISGKVSFITQYYRHAGGGLGRYEDFLVPELLKKVPIRLISASPVRFPGGIVGLARLSGRDLHAVAANYPCRLRDPLVDSLVHLCNQNLALALLTNRIQKSVITVHDIITYVDLKSRSLGGTDYGPIALLLLRVNSWAIRRADRVIAISNHTKRDLVEILGVDAAKVVVIPNGVDHTVYRPLAAPTEFLQRFDLAQNAKYVLYVGSRHPRKNLGTLCRAMARVRTIVPQARLLMVGPSGTPDQERALSASIQAAGLDQSVDFISFVPPAELPLVYNMSTLFVYPSMYEGFGLPPLEAMACGCPAVVSDATSLPEVVGNGGVLVDPEDVEGWVQAITAILKDDSLRDDLRQRGLERAAMFDWARTAEETIQVYQEMGVGRSI